jgi:hypothetical protein
MGEVDTGTNLAQGQHRQKVSESPSQQISWTWWYTLVIPAMLEALGRRITLQGQPEQKWETISEK